MKLNTEQMIGFVVLALLAYLVIQILLPYLILGLIGCMAYEIYVKKR
jgi:hypothetical protein